MEILHFKADSKLSLSCFYLVFPFLIFGFVCRRPRKWKLPNGPGAIPFVGNLGSIYGLVNNPVPTLHRFAATYGYLTTLWLGRSPMLIINDPDTAQELFDKNAAVTSARPQHNEFRQNALPDRIVVTSTASELKSQRRLIHDLLSSIGKDDLQRHVENESTEFLMRLLEKSSSFQFEVDRFAINVMLRLMYGSRLGVEDDKAVAETFKMWETMYLYFLPGTLPFDYFPFLLKIPEWMQPWSWLVQRLKDRERLFHINQTRISEIRTNPSWYSTTFIQKLKMIRENSNDGRDSGIDILAMLLGAGSDTTSAFLQNFFKVAAIYPDIVAHVQKEIDSTVGNDRLPQQSDFSCLPYLCAFVKELHRWAPIANIGIPHATTQPLGYGEFEIPTGTILVPNIPALNRSTKLFFNPECFEPSRYLPDSESQPTNKRKRDHYHYGFGRRICPGEKIAETVVHLAIARIIWGFNIQSIESTKLDMNDQRNGLLRKPLPFKLSILPRTSHHSDLIQTCAGKLWA